MFLRSFSGRFRALFYSIALGASLAGLGGSRAFAQEVNPGLDEERCILMGQLVDVASGLVVPGEPDYHIYKQCQVYQQNVFDACAANGWTCRNVNISCSTSVGHAVNIVQLSDGTWQLVDTTNNNVRLIGEPFPNALEIPQDLICSAIGKEPGCGCKVIANSDQPLPATNDPLSCSTRMRAGIDGSFYNTVMVNNVQAYRECSDCCLTGAAYYWSVNTRDRAPFTQKWSDTCLNACSAEFPSSGTDRWADRNGILLFQKSTAKPGNDSGANYFEAVCRRSTTNWSLVSQKLQCRECCLDGALQKKYDPTLSASCLNACDNFYW